MHSEELRTAAKKGDTETVVALLARGADVHGKTKGGYGSHGCIVVSVGSLQCGADGLSNRGGAAGAPVLAVQVHGAALCVAQRPDGDGNGAGQGGRGCALQDQQRVRALVAASSCRCVATVRGGTVRPLNVELRERLVWLCSNTALHSASSNGHTETALALVKAGADVHCKANEGCGSRAASSCRWGATVSGRTVRPLGTELQECLGSPCSSTALHRASQNGHTETAMALVKAGADVHGKDDDGYGFSGLHSHVVVSQQCRGGLVRPRGGEAAGVAVLAVAGGRRCTGLRRMGTRRRRWRW
jgi:hypothetical protein